jgi:hypothetical protein
MQRIFHSDKEANYLSDIAIFNIYVPNNGVSKYMRQKFTELQDK